MNIIKVVIFCFACLSAGYAWATDSNDQPVPDLTNWIVSPNGGEQFIIGQVITVNINWSLYSPGVTTIALFNGNTQIGTGSTSGGAGTRTISTTGLKPGSNYNVRIWNAQQPTEIDRSNASFTIGPIRTSVAGLPRRMEARLLI